MRAGAGRGGTVGAKEKTARRPGVDSEVMRAKADERHAMRELRQARRVEVPPPAHPHAAYPHARTHAHTHEGKNALMRACARA